jgi:hypothetical protein
VANELLGLVVELVAVVFEQEAGEGDQGAQGFVQVVRDDVGEFVKLAVLA